MSLTGSYCFSCDIGEHGKCTGYLLDGHWCECCPPRTLQMNSLATKQVFTPKEVVNLNQYQQAEVMHPFVCGSPDNRNNETHSDGEGLLVATVRGWICPFCDYTQDWAHDWMKNGAWRIMFPKPLKGRSDD